MAVSPRAARIVFGQGCDRANYIAGKFANHFTIGDPGLCAMLARTVRRILAGLTGWLLFFAVTPTFAFPNANGWVTNRTLLQTGATTYTYDPVGNLPNVAYAGGTPGMALTYDPLNRLTNMLDALGVTKFTYTAASQLASEDGPWTDDTITNLYTEGLRTTLAINNQPFAINYAYDLATRLTNLTSGAGAFDYGYKSSVSDLVTSIGLPNRAYITNRYDALLRMDYTALVNRWGRGLDGYGYSHDALGLRTNIARDYGLTTSTVSIGYDDLGQLTSWSAKDPGNVLRFNEQLGWNYDAAGNLHHRTNNALLQTFAVDNADQLTGISRNNDFTVTGNTPGPASSVTVNNFAADLYEDFTFARTNQTLANGDNPFTIIAQNAYSQKVTNSSTANLPASISLLYDLNGNLTNDGQRNFSYDAENQLTTNWVAAAWKTEFVYDGFGRKRVQRDYGWSGGAWSKTNETRYLYDGMLAIQERDASNNALVSYTRGLHWGGGIGGLLARTDHSTTNSQLSTSYYHADGSGNITALMDMRGDIVARYLYNPFGKQIGQWGALAEANRYRFSSKELQVNSGLYYYGFRFYEPNLQRWVNQDPIGEAGGINLYGFVDSSVPNNFDSWGLAGQSRPQLRGVSPNPLINLEIEADMEAQLRAAQANGRSFSRREFLRNIEEIEREVERNTREMNERYEPSRSFRSPTDREPCFTPLIPKQAVRQMTEAEWKAYIEKITRELLADGGLRGSQNPNTRASAGLGSKLHSDRPGNLPDQLREIFPESSFRFTRPGQPGQDVEVMSGKHPSQYPCSGWPQGINFGDFKPNTPGGRRTFDRDQQSKWNAPTVMLRYDPATRKLLPP